MRKEDLSTREGIMKWLKNPKIRRLVSEEFQRSGQLKKSNLFHHQIQQRKKILFKLKDTQKNLKNQLKTDPSLKLKMISLNVHNGEMKDKLFEEFEYTRTLNYMISRQNLILQFKSQKYQSINVEMRFLNIRIISQATPEINENLSTPLAIAQVIPDKKFMKPMKKELMTLRIFKKIKETAKNLVEEEEKNEREKQKIRASNMSHEKNQHKLKAIRDYQKMTYYMDNYDGKFHQKSNIDMLNDIIENSNQKDECKVCPYDPMKELTSENFFLNEEEREGDTQKIAEINQKINKDSLVSNNGHQKLGVKEYASREYIIMVKETFDEQKRKKEYLETLKKKLIDSEQKMKNKKSNVYNKIMCRLYKKKKLLNNIKSTVPDAGADSNSEVTTQVDGMSIPTLNDEVERVLLITNRERDEWKYKLLQSKSLIISS